MSKAEDLAEKAYPQGDTYIFGDAIIACQVAYVKGYHQAEKDLELTWEDMFNIFSLVNEVLDDYAEGKTKKEVGEEVLKRFKEKKEEMNDLFNNEGYAEPIKPTKFCRTCAHRQPWECGKRTIQYCGIRKSNRTYNGLLKIKVTAPACMPYMEAKTIGKKLKKGKRKNK